jgi:hypothetical protein
MLKLNIEIEGKTKEDLWAALSEVREKISETYTSGSDSNDDGEYNFVITGEEEKISNEED